MIALAVIHVLLGNGVEIRVLERGGGCDATARVERYHAAEEVEAVLVELPGSSHAAHVESVRGAAVCVSRRAVDGMDR